MNILNFNSNIIYQTFYNILYPSYSILFPLYRALNTQIGKNSKIAINSFVHDSVLDDDVTINLSCHISQSRLSKNIFVNSRCRLQNVSLGRFSYLASDSVLALTEVGNFCSIGSYLICGVGEHPNDFVSTHPAFFSTKKQCGITFSDKDYFDEQKKVFIGHDVWIGARVFIKNGVKIGNGAIIAAGSVVVKDVPDYAIVGGVPAKIIRYRFSHEVIRKLLDIQWWNWSEEKLQKSQTYFVNKNIYSFIEYVNNK